MSLIVLFDNNAYKRVSAERLAGIIEREREIGVTALASVAVAQELLARVRDPDARIRGRNRAAARKLTKHCRGERAGQPIVSFLTHVEGQVYHLFVGHPHELDAGVFEELGAMLGAVAESAEGDSLNSHDAYLKVIETNVAAVEQRYVTRLEDLAQNERPLEVNRMRRNLDYAEEIVRVSERLYGVSYGDGPAIVARILDVAKLTTLGFAVSDHVARTVREKGGGCARHGNTAWDVEIVSATSIYSSIDGRRIVVVTEENMLLDVAAAEGLQDRVMSLDSYWRLIGLE